MSTPSAPAGKASAAAWWRGWRTRPRPGAPLIGAAGLAISILPVSALARQSWTPSWLGFGLLVLAMGLALALSLVAVFTFTARPTGRQALSFAAAAGIFPLLVIARATNPPEWVGRGLDAVGVCTVVLILGGLVSGIIRLIGRVSLALADRALARRGRPTVDQSITAWFSKVTPKERAIALAGGMGGVWLLTSWMYRFPGGSNNPAVNLAAGLFEWLIPIGNGLAVTALGGVLLLLLIRYAETTEGMSSVVGGEEAGGTELARSGLSAATPLEERGTVEPAWLRRLRPAARQRPRTQYVQVRWHDLEQLLSRHDLLMEVSRPEYQQLVEAISERDYGRP